MIEVKDYNRTLEKAIQNVNKFNSIAEAISCVNKQLLTYETITKINRVSTMQNALSAAIESLNKINKNTISNNISNSLLKFSNSIDSSKINEVYENFNKFAYNLNSLSTSINNTIGLAYITSYQKIINSYTKKEILTANQLDYLTIIGDIYNNKIETLSYLNNNEETCNQVEQNQKLKSSESLVPIYYGYTYRKNSSETLKEVYTNSDFEVISISGRNIVKRMNDINTIYFKENGEYLFKYNPETHELAYNIGNAAQNVLGFKYIIDLFFKGIYESSGSGNNKILNMKLPCCSTMMLIKYFRNYFDHEQSNGTKKIKEVLNYIKEKIGKNLPDKPKEWLKLQACLYKDIEMMLDEIYNNLNIS